MPIVKGKFSDFSGIKFSKKVPSIVPDWIPIMKKSSYQQSTMGADVGGYAYELINKVNDQYLVSSTYNSSDSTVKTRGTNNYVKFDVGSITTRTNIPFQETTKYYQRRGYYDYSTKRMVVAAGRTYQTLARGIELLDENYNLIGYNGSSNSVYGTQEVYGRDISLSLDNTYLYIFDKNHGSNTTSSPIRRLSVNDMSATPEYLGNFAFIFDTSSYVNKQVIPDYTKILNDNSTQNVTMGGADYYTHDNYASSCQSNDFSVHENHAYIRIRKGTSEIGYAKLNILTEEILGIFLVDVNAIGSNSDGSSDYGAYRQTSYLAGKFFIVPVNGIVIDMETNSIVRRDDVPYIPSYSVPTSLRTIHGDMDNFEFNVYNNRVIVR